MTGYNMEVYKTGGGKMLVELTKEEVEKKLKQALLHLSHKDLYLFQIDANERSISHRLAVYLEKEFEGWHIDCEYNRKSIDRKTLDFSDKYMSMCDVIAKTVFPDIIVHQRGIKSNLLVIEMKKSTNQMKDDFDHSKLEQYKSQLEYKYAVFLRMNTDKTILNGNDNGNNIVDEIEWI